MDENASGKQGIIKAIAAVKKELGVSISADSEGQYGAYASLETVLKTLEPLLQKHGLVVIQGPQLANDSTPVLTTAVHLLESEVGISFNHKLCPERPGPQALGAAETYARRRSLMAIFGLATGEDDPDRKAAPQAFPSTAPRPQATRPTSNADRVINVGKKFKGLKFSDCDIGELFQYAGWLQGKAKEEGKPLSREAQAFIRDLEEYERSLRPQGQSDFAPANDETIPF